MKKFLLSIGTVLLVAFVCLYFYVSNISFNKTIDEGSYFVAGDDYAAYILLHENKTADIYAFHLKDGDVRVGVKVVMKCHYDWCNPFFGDYYFTTDSLLSLKKIDIDGDPAYLTMKCKDAVSFDFFWYVEGDSSSVIGEYSEERIPFVLCDSSFYLDGLYFPKVTDVPPQLDYYVDYLDELQSK